jgi:hypothetical protein
MGVDTTYYTMHGVVIDDEEFIDKFMNDHDSIEVEHVYDGMCGTYIVFGEILAVHDIYTNMREIDIQSLAERREKYIKVFVEEYPDLAWVMEKPFKIISFVHFS